MQINFYKVDFNFFISIVFVKGNKFAKKANIN